MTNLQPISIYFHIPFCVHRCEYCDFNTYAGRDNLIPAYVDALSKEVIAVTKNIKEILEVQTIFFGGGTPSLLSLGQLADLFKSIRSCFSVIPKAEISIEANPGTIDLEYLRGLQDIGFNRLSLGVQSTNNDELLLLGRIHSCGDIYKSIKFARNAGFDNLNLDLIYGLPNQNLEMWKTNLMDAINLKPEHLSLYALSIENGTSFGLKVQQGLMVIPDPDLAADMFEWSTKELNKAGFRQYEISNWARNGFECKHNLQTWHNRTYLGFGAGAHGFANNMRVSNVIRIKDYINRIRKGTLKGNDKENTGFPLSPAMVSKTPISRHTSMQETLLLGLRLTSEGVSDNAYKEKYGESLMEKFGNEITELINLNLLERKGDSVILTRKGRLLGNQVFIKFID